MLTKHLSQSIQSACADLNLPAGSIEVLPSQRPEIGQFQINSAMMLAKILRRMPAAIANDIVQAMEKLDYVHLISIDGPGFINFSLTDSYLAAAVSTLVHDERQGVPISNESLGSILLDYGGPNIAKAMHVGHLRSAIIGDTLNRLARLIGYEVTSDIHLGDWGLPMGMVLLGLTEKMDIHAENVHHLMTHLTVDVLNEIYPRMASVCREDAETMEAAKRLTVELQNGHPRLTAMWERIVEVSVADIRHEFGRLNVTFDLWFGESRVHTRLIKMIDYLKTTGAAKISDGALVIHFDQADDTKPMPPLILEKTDGGIMYGGTDLATIEDRIDYIDPDEIIYVVDQRQSLHFEMLFKAAAQIGLTENGLPSLEHVGFGTVNGLDGKALKTRAGGVLKLSDLIDQAEAIARQRFVANSFEGIEASEVDHLVRLIAVANIRFAELSHNRKMNYIFDLEAFSAAEGKTGLYLCYAAVRAGVLLHKAAARFGEFSRDGLAVQDLQTAVERRLALMLLSFPEAVSVAYQKRMPHILCDHLYDLAQVFSSFYHDIKILAEPDADRRQSLLALVCAAERQIRLGLSLLGITAPDKL